MLLTHSDRGRPSIRTSIARVTPTAPLLAPPEFAHVRPSPSMPQRVLLQLAPTLPHQSRRERLLPTLCPESVVSGFDSSGTFGCRVLGLACVYGYVRVLVRT